MSYEYSPAPKPTGGFNARIRLGDEIPEATLYSRAATRSGLTPAQIGQAVDAVLAEVLLAAADTHPGRLAGGRIRWQPTAGGSQPTPDGFHTPEDINADIKVAIVADTIRAWRDTLRLESQGEVGWVVPIIATILSEENGGANHYVPGTLIRLKGDHLDFDKTAPSQGVFLRPGTGAEVRCTVYGTITEGEVLALVPSTLSGPLQVRIVATVNGAERSATYTSLLV